MNTNLKSALARLPRTAVAAGLTGAAGLALVAAPIDAAGAATPNCKPNTCIMDLAVQRGGLTAGVTFTTTDKTKSRFVVYDTNGHKVVSRVEHKYKAKHKIKTAAKLQANTAYTFDLIVADKKHRKAESTGSVQTLHRRLTIVFSTVHVTDDSDDNGSGEFRTWAGLQDNYVVPPLTPTDINTGDTVSMAAVVVQQDADVTASVRTEMYDADNVGANSFPDDPDWTSGTNAFADWATAIGTINTKKATKHPKPFIITVDANVGFVVNGTYSVDFVS